ASPQDTVVVVDKSAAPVVDPATQPTPTDAAAAPTDAATSPTDAATNPSQQETFSAPPPAAAATPATQAAGTATPPASADVTASTDPSAAPTAPPVSALGTLASTSIVGTPDGTQLTLNGPGMWAGVSGSLSGSLAITPGTSPSDPVRIDGT